MTIFNKLAMKHIYFIITDYNWNIKLLIELDDRYHNNKKARENDKFKNYLMIYLKIPLMRYNLKSIREYLKYIIYILTIS